MADPRVAKLADILVNYSIGVKPGDWVFVNGSVLALPLIEEVMAKVLQAGGNPTTLMGADSLSEVRMRYSSDEQLQWISPVEKLTFNEVDAIIGIGAAGNTRTMNGVDPAKQQLHQKARSEIFATYMQRSAEGSLRWVGTQYPCNAYAQEADMSLSEYEDFVYGATYADQPDPVKCWQDVHDMQAVLVDWLKGKKRIEVRGPNVELSLSIEGRDFINSDGKHNMPSGEIFTSPIEDSVNGWVKFTYPALAGGREVDGIELRFEEGKVVDAKAKKNEAFLLSQLDSDEGARYLGEFAVGTNYGIQKFTKSILYDEKIGGTIHMAVGRGFPEIGGKNQSAIHWDMICDMREDSEILVDGELFYRNGQFQVG